jgi:hypothetical protein
MLALASCEKSGSSSLGSDDAALLKDLPAGNVALMGGNYMKLQNFMQSALGKMVRDVTAKVQGNDSMGKWMDCFAHFPKLRLVGGLATTDSGVEMRFVFAGMTVQDIQGCATGAGFQATLDSDGKFVAIDIPVAGMSVRQGYLVLADGALYMHQKMSFTGLPSVTSGTRAEFEADIATLAKATAADQKNLLDIVGKVDRSRTFWFAGTAANTSIGDKLGELYGSFEIENGLKVDITAQVKDSALADKAEQAITQIKAMKDQIPAELRGVIDDLALDRKGDHLHLTAKVTDEQLQAIAKLGGMGMGHGGL